MMDPKSHWCRRLDGSFADLNAFPSALAMGLSLREIAWLARMEHVELIDRSRPLTRAVPAAERRLEQRRIPFHSPTDVLGAHVKCLSLSQARRLERPATQRAYAQTIQAKL
jgi:hypothetical protein